MFIPTPLKAALEDSISSGTFIDTKFWAFSRRNRETGQLEHPRAVFTNSAVVRSIPYLRALLDEAPEGPLDAVFPHATDGPLLGDYEYESDADLYDGTPQNVPASGQDQVSVGRGLHPSRVGRTIIIRDAAFVTFHAVLAYLYTQEIEFNTPGRIGFPRFGMPSDVPPTSAKSVYRLADKYGIPDLKELALLEIKSDAKKCNIVEESFGKFPSWYPEIQELYMYRLAQVMCSSESPGPVAAFETKIQEYFAGKLPHAKGLLLSLFDFLASNKVLPHPSPPGSSHSTITPYSNVNHGNWIHVKAALIHSLTTGSFLDVVFYAEDSMELRPLFFCSTILPGLVKKISETGQLVPVRELQGNSETVTPVVAGDAASQDDIGEKVIKISSGDWKTWKSIFWYIYTANVLFTPLGTTRPLPVAGSSSNPETPHEGVDMKLVYDLATKISLEPLRELAGRNIRLSMTHENIVEEFLSPFSAEHEAIREMQHHLLRREFWTAEIQYALRMKIEEASNGKAVHCGPGMAAIFRGLTRSDQVEEPTEPPELSTFHTQPDPANSAIMLVFQNISTAPENRSTSQEELRVAHYQRTPPPTLIYHPSNFPVNVPLQQTGTRSGASRSGG